MNDAEPQAPGSLEDPPHWLTEEQVDGWRHALSSAPPGLLRRLDRGVLAVWVVAEDTHRRAAELLRTTQTLLMRQRGMPMPFPSLYLGIMNKQAMIMLKAAAELGFSPTARARAYAQPLGPEVKLPHADTKQGKRKHVSLAEYVANAPPRPVMH